MVPALEVQAAVLGPLCSVPLIIAGVALGHGLIALKRLAGGWLVGLYLAVLLLGNLICLWRLSTVCLIFVDAWPGARVPRTVKVKVKR